MPGKADIPPVPGVWRLGWLLFMQPTTLHRMSEAWGLKHSPSLLDVWPKLRARDPVALAVVARLALWPFVIMPATLAVTAYVTNLYITPIASRMAAQVALFGMATSITLSLAGSLFRGATQGISASALGMALSITHSTPTSVASYIVAGLVAGASTDMSLTVFAGLTTGKLPSTTIIAASGTGAGAAMALYFGLERGPAIGMLLGATCLLAFLRAPLWLFEAVATLLIGQWIRAQPESTRILSQWLPYHHHELIYFPLPRLRSLLLQVAETNPPMGKALIAEAATSTGQKRTARLALIELQARDLERAATGRLFTRAADLDFPFLPTPRAGSEDKSIAPILIFRSAAQDLVAGGNNHRQRRISIDRAYNIIDSFRTATVANPRPDPLARRLLSTATLWLDVIREEQHKLARQAAENPEIPAAFIAGSALTPADAENRPLFKGRDDVIKLIEHDLSPDRRGVLLVIGQRRMGKTSLRNYLPTHLGTNIVAVSDFQSLSGDPNRATPHLRILSAITAALPSAPPPPTSTAWGEALT